MPPSVVHGRGDAQPQSWPSKADSTSQKKKKKRSTPASRPALKRARTRPACPRANWKDAAPNKEREELRGLMEGSTNEMTVKLTPLTNESMSMIQGHDNTRGENGVDDCGSETKKRQSRDSVTINGTSNAKRKSVGRDGPTHSRKHGRKQRMLHTFAFPLSTNKALTSIADLDKVNPAITNMQFAALLSFISVIPV